MDSTILTHTRALQSNKAEQRALNTSKHLWQVAIYVDCDETFYFLEIDDYASDDYGTSLENGCVTPETEHMYTYSRERLQSTSKIWEPHNPPVKEEDEVGQLTLMRFIKRKYGIVVVPCWCAHRYLSKHHDLLFVNISNHWEAITQYLKMVSERCSLMRI